MRVMQRSYYMEVIQKSHIESHEGQIINRGLMNVNTYISDKNPHNIEI